MQRTEPRRDFSGLDALALAISLGCAVAIGLFSERAVEAALRLSSTQWLRDMSEQNARLLRDFQAPGGPGAKPLRTRYAEINPHSPLAWINRLSAVTAAWELFAHIREQTLPMLTVGSVGIGLMVLRRPRWAGAHWRWGPGRVAAATAVVFSGTGLAEEFVLRRFDLMKYGWFHDTLSNFWEYNAHNVAIATLAAWALLVPAGRWMALRGWREWLGVGLGVMWLANLAWKTLLEPLAQL